ncbi:MAG: helix-turn-helix domain-containing protein [Candidatus Puniceispirillales bacterium WSBS_2018_MAG_OTU23]
MESEVKKSSQDVLTIIGDRLRAERTRQGLSTRDVSGRLRIMETHIRNIELGHLDGLPASTYIIGYLRSYSALLGMDTAILCGELKASFTTGESKPDLKFIDRNIHVRTGAGRVALAALIAGFAIYGGWYGLSTGIIGDDDTVISNQIADVDITDAGRKILATAVAVDGVDVKFSDVEEVVDLTPPLSTPPFLTTPPATVAPDAKTTAVTTAELTLPPVIKQAVKVTDAQAVNRIPEREIILKATASSWVEITRADGSAVTARLMRVDDTYVVPSNEDLYLTAGNAGGINLTLGSDDPIILGAWGEALRELPLDETIINERY